jgi:hypothetical protein
VSVNAFAFQRIAGALFPLLDKNAQFLMGFRDRRRSFVTLRELTPAPTRSSYIMFSDLKFATRQLVKSPGFFFTALVTLALGIGANAVVFSVLNAVVLRPVNVPHADNLYTVQRFRFPSQSYLDYVDLRDRNRTFSSLIACQITGPVGIDTGKNPSTASPYVVTGNYFDALEFQPFLGRFFHASDE